FGSRLGARGCPTAPGAPAPMAPGAAPRRGRRALAVAGALLLLPARPGADAPAEPTLAGMLEKISSGKADNNFFHGMVVMGTLKDEKEAAAGCILDKIGAIVKENGVREFANDLQVDLAACCTKDTDDCVPDVTEAYGVLTQVRLGQASAESVEAQVAALLIRAAGKRISLSRVKLPHARYPR
ncbi:unnamed protein product, partial [Prorocentrum cordatum]